MQISADPDERPAVDQRQYAALPFVVSENQVRILLVTSRETRRWIIPKGWPIRGLAGHEVAEREAAEEAGVSGQTGKQPIGHFSYRKKLHYFSSVDCLVEVYALQVEKQKLHWRERAQRQIVWVPAAEAAEMVNEPELARIIRDFQGLNSADPMIAGKEFAANTSKA